MTNANSANEQVNKRFLSAAHAKMKACHPRTAQATQQPDVVSFGGGMLGSELFPVREIEEMRFFAA